MSIPNHEHVLKIMHSLRFTHLIISWEVSKESVVNVLKPPQFWASATRSRCSRKSWATCHYCDITHRMSRGWSFIQFVPVHNQWVPLFHLQGQRCSWVSLGPIGSQLVMEFFTEDHTLDADHHEWIRKKKSFYLRENNVEAQAHATKNNISTIGTGWNLVFCWRSWRSQETAIGCGEGFKDLSAQDLTSR